MPISGANLDLTSNAGDGANNWKLEAAESGAFDDTTKANYGTNTTLRWILLQPGATNSTSATPSAGQDFGWNVLEADMEWDANLPASRVIPSGAWFFEVDVAQSAVAPPTNFRIQVFVHRRTDAGVLTELFNHASGNQLSVGGGSFNLYNFTTASQPEFVFADGETLHVEYWANSAAGALGTTNVLTLRVNNTPRTRITLPGAFRTRFPRTLSMTASAVVALLKKVGKRVTATATGTATLSRALTLARTISATASGAASLARRLLFARTVSAVAVGPRPWLAGCCSTAR